MDSIENLLTDNGRVITQTRKEINTILESFSKPNIIKRLSFVNVLSVIFE